MAIIFAALKINGQWPAGNLARTVSRTELQTLVL